MQHANPNTPEQADPAAHAAATLCPYCGHTQAGEVRCDACGGLFEPLSRQASQNAMGPWFIRDPEQPHRPGCSHQTLTRLAAKGRINLHTIIRGPSTRQFWAFAKDIPGVAHLLGQCHNCAGAAEADEYMCRGCGAVFVASSDRQQLGLAPVRLLPGQASAAVVATPAVRSPVPAAANVGPASAQAPQPVLAGPLPPPTPAQPQQGTVRRLRRQVSNLKGLVALLAVVLVVMLGVMAFLVLDRLSTTPTVVQGLPVQPGETEALPGEPEGGTFDPLTNPSSAHTPEAAQRLEDAIAAAVALAEPDTIEAVKEALEALRAIRAANPDTELPANLNREIQRLEARLDDLTIRRYL